MNRIVIMHETVTNHDAIGNDIEKMFEILNETSECVVYAQNKFNTKVKYIDKELLENLSRDKNTILIYHHSVYWEFGEKILDSWQGKIIIRYHNITPPVFFEKYNEHHFNQCKKGRQQTERFIEKFKTAYWLCASEYNCQDLQGVDISKIKVCAPFNKIEEWGRGKPNEEIMKQIILSDDINLLFVGRVAPNKGHLFLIDVVNCFCHNYGDNIKLRIIGKFDDGLSGYNAEIDTSIRKYGLEKQIEFIGEINDSTLMSYYLASDFYVCASEHEGFCVPVVESQYFQLPIIARRMSAVPETLGGEQVLLRDEIKDYAAAIHVLYENDKYYSYLQRRGKDNFEQRFSYVRLKEEFVSCLEKWVYCDGGEGKN